MGGVGDASPCRKKWEDAAPRPTTPLYFTYDETTLYQLALNIGVNVGTIKFKQSAVCVCVCVCVCVSSGRGVAMSVFFAILKGPYDALLLSIRLSATSVLPLLSHCTTRC